MVKNQSHNISMAISIHSQQLENLRKIMRDVNTLLLTRTPHEILSPIIEQYEPKEKARAFLNEFLDYFGTIIEAAQRYGKDDRNESKHLPNWNWQEKYPKDFGEMLWPILVSAYRTVTQHDLFFDMILTHAVTVFEDFLKDFLMFAFLSNPNRLKSENTITYKQVLSFKSIQELRNHLATDKVNKIFDRSIDDVAKQVKKLFSIDFTLSNDFHIVREASYRRNVIVHNAGIIDNTYHRKLPNSKIGAELHTDFNYMETLFDAIGRFIDFLDDRFSVELKYDRQGGHNALLNPPDAPDV